MEAAEVSYHRQPALHDSVTLLWAPAVCLSAGDGQIRAGGLDGFYRSDRRMLSRLEVELEDAASVSLGHQRTGAAGAVFTTQVRPVGDRSEDATVLMHRYRDVWSSMLTERLHLTSFSAMPVTVTMRVRCASDLAAMQLVRSGGQRDPVAPELGPDHVAWSDSGYTARLTSNPAPLSAEDVGGLAELTFRIDLEPGQSRTITMQVLTEDAPDPDARVFLPAAQDDRPVLSRSALGDPTDPRRRQLLETSLQDLEHMLLADPRNPTDRFLAAGSPWYFTLFGRDALWSAQLLLPADVGLAGGTLRALARRQGRQENPATEEQPGKILHEVRRETLRVGDMVIPPVYYGTIDATLLWIRLLHDAFAAGMPEAEVADLLPNLQAALGWILRHADADGDGFVEYLPSVRGALANQGWKDTPDAVRWADGRRATAPLALCEVQGYAYAAATKGAELLDSFGLPDASRWRDWAGELKDRFRKAFWITDEFGRYPAIALDANKEPVDGAASNMGHLLGTGLLTPEEARSVAERIVQPDLNCGFGLRTLSSASEAFNPLSYHCGSVWPHDTAISVLGLAAEGHHASARLLADGILAAAETFDFRLPELFAGTSAGQSEPVVPYATACRPQAWSAAGAVAIVSYLEGWSPAP
jgi:glycogen debranching enzyme